MCIRAFPKNQQGNSETWGKSRKRFLSAATIICTLALCFCTLALCTLPVSAADNWVTLEDFEGLNPSEAVPAAVAKSDNGAFTLSVNTNATYVNSGDQSILCDYTSSTYPRVDMYANQGSFVGDGLRFYVFSTNAAGANVGHTVINIALRLSDNTSINVHSMGYFPLNTGWFTVNYANVAGLTQEKISQIVGVRISSNDNGGQRNNYKLYLDDLQVLNPAPAVSGASASDVVDGTATVSWNVAVAGKPVTGVNTRLYYSASEITQADIDGGSVTEYTQLGNAATAAAASATLKGLPVKTRYFALKAEDTASGKTVYAFFNGNYYKTILGFEGWTSASSSQIACGGNTPSLNTDPSYVRGGGQSLRVLQSSLSNQNIELLGNPGDFDGDGLRVFLWLKHDDNPAKATFNVVDVRLILDDGSVINLIGTYSSVTCNQWYTVDYAAKNITSEQRQRIKGLRFALNQYNDSANQNKQSIYLDDFQVINPVSGALSVVAAAPVPNGTASVNKTTAEKANRVEVTVTPTSGYRLKADGLSYVTPDGNVTPLVTRVGAQIYENASENEEENCVKFFFEMPSANVVVKAEFISDSQNNLAVFGGSIRESAPGVNSGLQFGSRVYKSYDSQGLTSFGTLLFKKSTAASNGLDIESATHEELVAWIAGNPPLYVNVPSTKLLDRCNDYVDFACRLTSVTEKGLNTTEYVAVAYAEYGNDGTIVYSDPVVRSYNQIAGLIG